MNGDDRVRYLENLRHSSVNDHVRCTPHIREIVQVYQISPAALTIYHQIDNHVSGRLALDASTYPKIILFGEAHNALDLIFCEDLNT